VRSYLGYCDGRRVRVYQGATRGRVADRARGRYTFAWDPIFIPETESRSYGEMGLERKRHTSPVYKAWDAFFEKEGARFARAR
jgi:XTP/dITP diphosphohydrolase